MTYPPPQYFDDSGLINVTNRDAHTKPELAMETGVEIFFLLSAAESEGEVGLFRWDASDERVQALPHFHRGISEAFFVLSGIFTFYDGEQWSESGAGDFHFVPKGGIHGFKNDHGAASMLMLFTPGAPREEYFALLAERAAGRLNPTPEEWVEISAQHDQFYPREAAR